MVLSTLAGISGNSIITPVCLIFFQFDPHVAIAHTNLLGVFSSAARIYIEMKHAAVPGGKSNINFDAILISTTPTIIGTFVGVFFNKMSPPIIIISLASVLQMGIMVKSFHDYKIRAEKERLADKSLQEKLV